MKPDKTAEIHEILEQIRSDLAALAARVDKLEGKAPVREVQPAQPPPPERLSDEILTVIAAAVAAFLGERVHIRQIRVLSSAVWAQEGRVSIQASHRLH